MQKIVRNGEPEKLFGSTEMLMCLKKMDLAGWPVVELLVHHVFCRDLLYADAQNIWSTEGLWFVVTQHSRDALYAAIHVERAGPEVCQILVLQVRPC